jgi:CMP-N,N'-diacetyllegionaminic acid synthase
MQKNKNQISLSREILALIPARGGSTGLPGKNIRVLGGLPLIAHTIKEAQKSKHITRIIVATDSEEIAEISRNYGAETPFVRPPEVSGHLSHAFEIYKYSAEWLLKNEGYTSDIQCNLLPTTPLRSHHDIDKCMNLMIESNCDWCFTVNEMEHHPYRGMVTLEDNRMKSLFDIPREELWSNRQELPKIVRFNGGVMAGKTEHIMKHDEYNIDNIDFSDTDVRYVEMPMKRSYDIDTLEDFQFIENVAF